MEVCKWSLTVSVDVSMDVTNISAFDSPDDDDAVDGDVSQGNQRREIEGNDDDLP